VLITNKEKKMISKMIYTLATLLCIAALEACSVSADGGGGNPAKPSTPGPDGFFDTKPTISGPTVEGHWTSLCKKMDKNYRRFDVVFKDDTVVRSETQYSDAGCAAQISNTSLQGRFRFIEKFDDGFGIEYAFNMGSGVTTFPQEKIAVQDKALYLSDFVAGSLAKVLSDEPLYIEGATPSPTPVQGVHDAEMAYSYADAKYAFCSNQGYGFLIDFQGTSLSKAGTGTAKIGYKVCGSQNDIQWFKKARSISVELKDGYPQISMGGDPSYPDYIQTSSYRDGISAYREAFSSMSGNSGGCFFLKNDGTGNLPFTYDCY
jgi:hypothetical protein